MLTLRVKSVQRPTLLPTCVFPKSLSRGNPIPLFPTQTAVLTVRFQVTWEQCGANGVIIVVDIVTVVIDGAVIVDICSVVRIVAGRPQPPPAESGSIESPD